MTIGTLMLLILVALVCYSLGLWRGFWLGWLEHGIDGDVWHARFGPISQRLYFFRARVRRWLRLPRAR